MQIDIKIVAGSIGPNHDLLDQRTNAAHRFFLGFFIGKTFDELRNGGAVAFAHAGLDQLGFCVSACKFGLEGVAPLDRCVEIRFDFRSFNRARTDDLDQFVPLGHYSRKFLLKLAAPAAPFLANRCNLARVFEAKRVEQFGIEQTIAQADENHVFQSQPRHSEPVRAEPFVLIGRAAEVVARVFCEGAAA